MAMFVNYQKMRRKVEETTTAFLQRGNISHTINYEYDTSGNPVNVKLNSGTQTIQTVYINRDEYGRTRSIQYMGTIGGFMTRQLDEDFYNPTSEAMQAIETFRIVDNSCIEDKLDESTIPDIQFN